MIFKVLMKATLDRKTMLLVGNIFFPLISSPMENILIFLIVAPIETCFS